MTDNDIIAEYVKANHPELMNKLDFVKFRITKIVEEDRRSISEAFEKLKADMNEPEPVSVLAKWPYFEYFRQKGIEYCKKNCGTQGNLCGRCPLAFNFCCINQKGLLIINNDVIDLEAAVVQFNHMIEEITEVKHGKKED